MLQFQLTNGLCQAQDQLPAESHGLKVTQLCLWCAHLRINHVIAEHILLH